MIVGTREPREGPTAIVTLPELHNTRKHPRKPPQIHMAPCTTHRLPRQIGVFASDTNVMLQPCYRCYSFVTV